MSEVVSDGISGYVCQSWEEMSGHAPDIHCLILPGVVLSYAERHFSTERMAAEYLEPYDQVYEATGPGMFEGTADSGGPTAAAA